MDNIKTEISNVLVIGSGGAGLRAAIEVKAQGLAVKVLGKRPKIDVHTGLAAGGINAPFANLDDQDSWEQHFADTFLEGYGIGNPEQIEIMAKDAKEFVSEIDQWGAHFNKLSDGNFDQRFFGAHTYRRTCFSGDYTGQSILNALLKKADSLNIKINDSEYVYDLLVSDNCCFGAISFNINNGLKTVHLADAVILCTGGHTRIWKRSSSRKNENNGDGYYLALKAGCNLIDMEMVQFHPTGMVKPEEIAGWLVTEAVRGEGGKLINGKGERFMQNYDKERMELSTRDKIAFANYTEIIEGRSSPNGGVFLDISHKDKNFIIEKIPKIYRQFIETQMIDISKKPMEVAPTAHYSMGGIEVKANDHSTCVKGLFAAGEVAGGLHGANRLGGNSLSEILIFGKKAGESAANFSRNLEKHNRSSKAIKSSSEKISRLIKNGDELAIPLLHELGEVMWKYCGVVKNEKNLKTGLMRIKQLKIKSKNVDIRVDDGNYQDLINFLNLESSLVTAEATILSALQRKESRGAHQRNDYPNIETSQECNYTLKLKNEEIIISKRLLNKIRDDLKNIIQNSNRVKEMKGKLLE